jgi:enterochelin esterase-like enzyme
MLERDMYRLFERSKIPFAYEAQKFELDPSFTSPNDSFERFMNGKGDFKNRGNKKYRSAVYTPDFTPPVGKPLKWVVEIKGRSFPDFGRTWRLFKKYLIKEKLDTVCFVPRNIEDCKEVIKAIKKL